MYSFTITKLSLDICKCMLFYFSHVREFYMEVTEKLVKKFPFSDTTLKTLGFVDPDNRDQIDAESGNNHFLVH